MLAIHKFTKLLNIAAILHFFLESNQGQLTYRQQGILIVQHPAQNENREMNIRGIIPLEVN